ncbi:MAG: HNH endonuclease [Bacteroidetes bacterium]|nr:HNH endonuclease [Bacteroidota bacterium]
MLTAEYTILQNPFYNLFEHGILFSAKKRLLDLKFPFSQQEIANIETILNNNIIKIDDPGENLPEESYFEGAGKQITVNRYERNGEARLACLEIHGYECTICGFNFENRYGEIGKDYIQVHHIESIASKNGEEYEINPETDLIPVCPNCHAMLHRKTPPFNTEELKQILLGNK